MSAGRVEFGIGAGWFEAEHRLTESPSPPLGERFERLEEQLDIITGMWDHPGRPDVRLHRQALHRRPLPCPAETGPATVSPIIIGGGGPKRTPALAARYATEFNLAFPTLDFVLLQLGTRRGRSRGSGPAGRRHHLLRRRSPSAPAPTRPRWRGGDGGRPRSTSCVPILRWPERRRDRRAPAAVRRRRGTAGTCNCWTCPTSSTCSSSPPRSCPASGVL